MTPSAPELPADFILVLVTVPNTEVAGSLATTLVTEKLVACVNIVPGLRSIYAWQDKVCDESEMLCLMKTRRELFPALRDQVTSLHPYQVPEIVAIALTEASPPYLAWLGSVTPRPSR